MVIQPSTGEHPRHGLEPHLRPQRAGRARRCRPSSWRTSATPRRTTRASSRCGPSPPARRSRPGPTMKVVTSTAAYNLKPSLAGLQLPGAAVPDVLGLRTSPLCDQSGPCGGTMTQMLPFSCDPGYAELGVQLGVPDHDQAGRAVRLQLGARRSTCPRRRSRSSRRLPPNSQAFLGQSSIGQYDVQTTALPERHGGGRDRQRGRADDAAPDVVHPRLAGLPGRDVHAEGGVDGGDARRRRSRSPRSWRAWWPPARRPASASPSYLCAAVKTGTAQTEPDHRADRHLDDRLRSGQPPPGGGGGRRAPAGQQLRRRPGGRARS